ncbi:MAG: Rieske (2Fe-2S) protein [Alphaproteobacteria bacterium]
MGRVTLCRLDDIPSPGSKGFTLGEGAQAREIFVVRDASGVYAYENDCPHTGGPLDWTPDRFLTFDRERILCATHGAEFRIADGYCVHGPCAGKSLAAVRIALDEGEVIVIDDDSPACRDDGFR